VVKEMIDMIKRMKNCKRIIMMEMGRLHQTVTTIKHLTKTECKNNKVNRNN
jgi:hypothetical protein